MGVAHTQAESLNLMFLTNLLKFTTKKRYNKFTLIECRNISKVLTNR